MKNKDMTKRTIKILSLEDSFQDFEIISEYLQDAGYNLLINRVTNEKDFTEILKSKNFDAILADFNLPGFDAFTALQISSELCPAVPFICVSGKIGEDTAIDLIKKGAVDYILKDRLDKLPFAVDRALNEAKEKEARLAAEKALQDSEEKYRSLVENINDAIFIIDKQGIISYISPPITSIAGYKPSDLIGKPFSGFIHTDDLARITQQFQKVLSGKLEESEYRVQTKTGEICWVRSASKPILKNRKPAGIQGILTDISERKKAEQALYQSEERYRSIVKQASEGIVLYDLESKKIIETNTAYQKMLGYSAEEMTKLTIYDIVAHERKSINNYIKRIQNSSQLNLGERKHRCKDGSIIDVEVSSSLVTFEDKEVLSTVVHDITKRKQSEAIQKIQFNIAQFMAEAADLKDLFLVVKNELNSLIDTKNFVLALYDEKEGMLHTPFMKDEEDIIPSSWKAERSMTGYVILKEKPVLVRKNEFKKLLETGEIDLLGSLPEVWIGVPLFARNKIVGVIILQDYDDQYKFDDSTLQLLQVIGHGIGNFISRKQSEAEREKLSKAIEQSAELVVLTDKNGDIYYVNPAFEQVTGFTRAEALGRNPRMLKSAEHDDDFYKQLWETISGGRVWRGKIVNRRKDLSLFTQECTISPVFDSDRNISAYVAVMRDITREQELEQQFMQAQKMESIGRLAGGVAHDFNNMLSVILGYSELALVNMTSSDPLYNELNEISKAGRRSADLTKQLLAFARKQTITPQLLDLNDTISNMLKMLRRLIGEDIDLVWIPGAALGLIYFDPAQIDQILANLCINARDAISGTGRVTIETERVVLDEAFCSSNAFARPGKFIMLSVSDTGCGMDQEILSQVFEPFFTTKPSGEGTGLGLATVYGIVKQNDALIDVDSEPEQGTAFRIYFPLDEKSQHAGLHEEESEMPQGSGELILLVEDEPAILDMIQTMMKQIGYSVITANSPQEALKIAEKQDEEIELLVTDVVMPDMNGKELAQRMQEYLPDIKVLYMSGYTADVVAHKGILDEEINFINKPVTMASLAQKINEILGE